MPTLLICIRGESKSGNVWTLLMALFKHAGQFPQVTLPGYTAWFFNCKNNGQRRWERKQERVRELKRENDLLNP